MLAVSKTSAPTSCSASVASLLLWLGSLSIRNISFSFFVDTTQSLRKYCKVFLTNFAKHSTLNYLYSSAMTTPVLYPTPTRCNCGPSSKFFDPFVMYCRPSLGLLQIFPLGVNALLYGLCLCANDPDIAGHSSPRIQGRIV